MNNKKPPGFTLIEVMIVAAIIIILALITVPMYQKYMNQLERNRTPPATENVPAAENVPATENVPANGAGQ